MAASTGEGFRTSEGFRTDGESGTDDGFRPDTGFRTEQRLRAPVDVRADGGGAPEPPRALPRARRRTPRHEIRALLRAHRAATGFRHLARHCAVCARPLRLATDPVTASQVADPTEEPPGPSGAPTGPRRAAVRALGAPRGDAPAPGGPEPVHDGRSAPGKHGTKVLPPRDQWRAVAPLCSGRLVLGKSHAV
ncbi:DUF6274 family protein [Streptomyces sp. NPDC048680]|uniref:DUF6274 family protein n=1 Tax=Streptomyces sp. NPDC048680 TaxID=3155492 RepID=UPI0034292AEB